MIRYAGPRARLWIEYHGGGRTAPTNVDDEPLSGHALARSPSRFVARKPWHGPDAYTETVAQNKAVRASIRRVESRALVIIRCAGCGLDYEPGKADDACPHALPVPLVYYAKVPVNGWPIGSAFAEVPEGCDRSDFVQALGVKPPSFVAALREAT